MYMLNSYLFNKIPNPLGQQKQKFPRVIDIIYMKISSAGTWASGSDNRLSYLFPPLPSSVGHDVYHESLLVSRIRPGDYKQVSVRVTERHS